MALSPYISDARADNFNHLVLESSHPNRCIEF